MCFSVNVNLIREELESRYGATLIDNDKYRPSYYYHAFAIPEMPVVCSEDPSKIKLYKWGLIPSSARDIDEANNIRLKAFNARAESLDTKKTFSLSFRSKRCIVPVKGFFEWQHRGKEKIPWYIHDSQNEIMSLAGLYDHWTESSTGEVLDTFTIITTDANEMLAEIHNSALRMPAILDRVSEKLWLDTHSTDDELKTILKPSPAEMLSAYTIGPLVNDRLADRNTPEVIRPWQYSSLLF